MSANQHDGSRVIHLPARPFLAACAATALAVLLAGWFSPLPLWLLGAQVLATVVALFALGSFRYRLDKNVLTCGAALVVTATFWGVWWEGSPMRQRVLVEGWGVFFRTLAHYLFTLDGLEKVVHADMMLFILGLTLFVSVISQTRMLESVSFAVLRHTGGNVVPTVAAIAAIVSVVSGILDGVSMIGLMIRTLVIILLLAGVERKALLHAVLVSTIVTTVCGMWLAYGEPPNLIMKSNLYPHLDDVFFLSYCAPLALASYGVVAWDLKATMRGRRVDLDRLDVLDLHAADVKFLQASRHGEVPSPIHHADAYGELLGPCRNAVLERLYHGEPLGAALIAEGVPPATRREILGTFLSEDLAETLDRHYAAAAAGDVGGADRADDPVEAALTGVRARRVRAQRFGAVAFLPFVGLLVWHAVDHDVPLFVSSFAGFAVALLGIHSLPRMRSLALREARHEFAEYYFLLPLFLCITLLQTAGFFDRTRELLHAGVEALGATPLAVLQFAGTTALSALLDNNVVADFAGRALHGLEEDLLHFFAMAQIAGYAVGGCWTHIGSAQSVVAFAFVRREIDAHFTPFQWIRSMTPVLCVLFVLLATLICLRGWWMDS